MTAFEIFREKLRARLAPILDKYEFDAQATVVVDGLDPARPQHQREIDRATSWCERGPLRGRYRRHVEAAEHRLTWAFESPLDSLAFRQRFGGVVSAPVR